MTAKGIEARSDETPKAAQPEGREPGAEGIRPETNGIGIKPMKPVGVTQAQANAQHWMEQAGLAPCKCGGAPTLHVHDDPQTGLEYGYACGTCDKGVGLYKTEAEAIAAWNTRITHTPTPAESPFAGTTFETRAERAEREARATPAGETGELVEWLRGLAEFAAAAGDDHCRSVHPKTVARGFDRAADLLTLQASVMEEMAEALMDGFEIIEKHVPEGALGSNWQGNDEVPGGVQSWAIRDEHLHYMRQALTRFDTIRGGKDNG